MSLLIYTLVVGVLGFSPRKCKSKEIYEKYSFIYKVIFYNVAMTGQRFMYYTPFCFSDANMIACGISYNGSNYKDGKLIHKWDKIVNVSIIALEYATSPVEMMRLWNHQTHLWLKNYVTLRMVKPGTNPGFK